MDLGLKDKTALVTGGSHGIGRASAISLAAETMASLAMITLRGLA